MLNMANVRFENTNQAMQECINALTRQEPISNEELAYAERLRENYEEFMSALRNYNPKNTNDNEKDLF